MTEWAVVGVIIALVGLVTGIVTPLIKLNTTIVKLTTIVDQLAKNLAEVTEKNTAVHKELYKQVNDHERRIVVLEDHDRQ